MPRLITRYLIVFLIVLPATLLWAGLVYDLDGDCDADGRELFTLLSMGSQKIEDNLPGFAAEFGTLEDCCDPIGVGSPNDGYPSWQERTMIVFTNMVRLAPTAYRDKYMTGYDFPAEGILNLYPAVAPLYWNHELNQAARFHAEDMAFNCGTLQHDSCDGTSWSDRIRSFYPYSVSLGENIAYGFPTAWATVNAFLCDRYSATCAPDSPDSSGEDGHRKNIMRAQYREIGTGYAQNSPDYWVQDFGGRQPDLSPPVVSASHAFLEDGVTSFFLNYHDSAGAAPRKIQLVLDNIQYPLDLDTGAEAAGSYRVDMERAAGCRSYFFLAITSDGTCYRYPGTSEFYTYGEGDCLLDYDASQ
jgi:hypothetical protein